MNLELKEMYDIKNVVKTKARYQKVMLLFDDSVSETEIRDLYELIRNDCVYNKMNISLLDRDELMNGYRLVIFYMTGQSFLKTEFDKNEFMCVYIPTDKFVLPFFAEKDCEFETKKNYIILSNCNLDGSILSSIYFNKVFSHIYNTIYNIEDVDKHDIIEDEVSIDWLIDIFNKEKNFKFIDLEILKVSGLDFDKLILVDFVLLEALELFIRSIRNKTLSMVDVYKVAQNDILKINMYYEMMNNYAILEILNLNFNCLTNSIGLHKKYIMDLLTFEFSNNDIEDVINAVHFYAKTNEGIMGYLYFYGIV